jgi:hypothetical protein
VNRRSAVALCVALLATGCSVSGGGDAYRTPGPQDEVRAAVARTVRTTARVETRIGTRVGTGWDTKLDRIDVTGDFDLARDRGRLAATFSGGTQRADEIFADGTVYVRGLAPERPDVWLTTPRKDATSHYLLRAPLNDPEYVFEQLANAKVLGMVGEREVNGSIAFLFRARFDFPTFTHRMDPALLPRAEELWRDLGNGQDLNVLVWVDALGRVVRTEVTFSQTYLEISLTTTLSDFGKPVGVAAPPQEEVAPPSTYGELVSHSVLTG